MYKVYGIKNCDTVKKALKYLDSNKIDYEFVDFKKNTPTGALLKSWKKELQDWPVNRKGRTFRQMSEVFEVAGSAEKIHIIQENTSMIKRPVLVQDQKIICLGFDAQVYESLS